jgi:hypothetical protein
MLPAFHVQMMQLALGDRCSGRALAKIVEANLRQDRPLALIGYDEYHFDNSAFEKSYAYIEEQRALAVASLLAEDAPAAWQAFGRLTHTAQDFYAHSNYIDLWLASQPDGTQPGPSEVDPLDPGVLRASALRSGKVYILEALTLIPGLRPLVLPLLPRDSHAWMNLDAPERGPSFAYAFHAAVKRTKIEFERTVKDLPEDSFRLFVDV